MINLAAILAGAAFVYALAGNIPGAIILAVAVGALTIYAID